MYNDTEDMFTDVYLVCFLDKNNKIYQGVVNIDSVILNADYVCVEEQTSKVSDFSFWKMEIMNNNKSQLTRVTISEENLNFMFGLKNGNKNGKMRMVNKHG